MIVEVAFHLILYLREVYPSSALFRCPQLEERFNHSNAFNSFTALFRQVKKYDSPVWQSRNPALTEYLGRVLECIEEEMLKVLYSRSFPSFLPFKRNVLTPRLPIGYRSTSSLSHQRSYTLGDPARTLCVRFRMVDSFFRFPSRWQRRFQVRPLPCLTAVLLDRD